jgi:hypothetical protein
VLLNPPLRYMSRLLLVGAATKLKVEAQENRPRYAEPTVQGGTGEPLSWGESRVVRVGYSLSTRTRQLTPQADEGEAWQGLIRSEAIASGLFLRPAATGGYENLGHASTPESVNGELSMTANGPVREIGSTSQRSEKLERPGLSAGSRLLTETQIESVRRVMRVFVEDDLARGVLPSSLQRCDICQAPRPMVGFIRYDTYEVCNRCATDYELALMSGSVFAIEPFIRSRSTRAAA